MGSVKEHTFYCTKHSEFSKEQGIKIHLNGTTTVYCPTCIKSFLDEHVNFWECKNGNI